MKIQIISPPGQREQADSPGNDYGSDPRLTAIAALAVDEAPDMLLLYLALCTRKFATPRIVAKTFRGCGAADLAFCPPVAVSFGVDHDPDPLIGPALLSGEFTMPRTPAQDGPFIGCRDEAHSAFCSPVGTLLRHPAAPVDWAAASEFDTSIAASLKYPPMVAADSQLVASAPPSMNKADKLRTFGFPVAYEIQSAPGLPSHSSPLVP